MMATDHGPLRKAITTLVSLGLGIARLSELMKRDGLCHHYIHSRRRQISLSNQQRPASQRKHTD